ncbi:PepSY-like domain-containing protein [Emticicia sp. 21SJ11W-3]|uniref:PepSY-like domain-containing protein n=1 Tax=Emticicia sp. 21SJ11W-3 TaxID=2916755 RepID=UPI00209EEC23|nr:PepSY-like domain-containing protein [Emticicia sp. 21SJ11W-3]UTA69281.1 hypothetical protein MB380_05620 [Emticicia sp. 21SJ11W-3]
MKKLYIYLFLTSWVFSACDSVKDLQPALNANEAVPQVAVNAIKQEFPEATQIKFSTLEKGKLWESSFQFKVDRMSAVVNNSGKISEAYKITNSVQLPENARTYINNNYPGAEIKYICQQMAPANGSVIGYKVIVKLTDGKEIAIVFDSTGTLVLVAANDRPGPPQQGNGQGGPKIYFIEETDLPTIIRTYLGSKHEGYTFVKAAVSLMPNGKLYSVVVSKDMTSFEYLFDEKGNVLRAGNLGIGVPFNKLEYKLVSLSELPQTIKDGLNKNFTSWTYENGIKFSQSGQLQGYFILVTADKKQFSLQFNDKGDFMRGGQVCGPLGASSGKYEIKTIQPKDLPEAISSFLISRHQDFSYIQTSLITDKDKKIYWVAIIRDDQVLNYAFDDKGKIISIVETILKVNIGKGIARLMQEDNITEKIKTYINSYYPGWSFQTGMINFVDNQLFSYIVVIKTGIDIYILSFDANSNFVAARKG